MFRRSAIRAGLLTGTAALMLASQAAREREPVDIELVLAVDVSGSVDGAEQELQRAGLVAAFRDPEVISAIAALPRGLAVALVAWAGVRLRGTGSRIAPRWMISRPGWRRRCPPPLAGAATRRSAMR